MWITAATLAAHARAADRPGDSIADCAESNEHCSVEHDRRKFRRAFVVGRHPIKMGGRVVKVVIELGVVVAEHDLSEEIRGCEAGRRASSKEVVARADCLVR